MKLALTDEALEDLQSIGDWIAHHNSARAKSFIAELRESCAEILNFPDKYQLVEGRETSGLRRKVHGEYLIFYRVHSGRLDIVHIQRASRDLSKFF